MQGIIQKSRMERIGELTKDIQYLLDNNPVRVLQISRNALADFSKARDEFGEKSPVTAESLKVTQEIQAINYIEEKLLRYIYNNLESFDIDSTEKVVMILDKLSTATFKGYEGIVSEIDRAIDSHDEMRPLRPANGFPTLLNNANYTNMVVALGQNQNKVKDFLGFEPEFWKFIKTYEKIVPTTAEGAEVQCGIIAILSQDGKSLHNFYTVVPRVINMETAYIAIDIYKKAHDMYLIVGKEYTGGNLRPSTEEQLDYRDFLSEQGKRITK